MNKVKEFKKVRLIRSATLSLALVVCEIIDVFIEKDKVFGMGLLDWQ